MYKVWRVIEVKREQISHYHYLGVLLVYQTECELVKRW